MPSAAYESWKTTRAAALDEVEAAHAAVGGTGPGRRHATRQLNRAYILLLAAEFQGFCRKLHDECAAIIASASPAGVRELVLENLGFGRQLDRGNATPGSLGADFGWLGIKFWPELVRRDKKAVVWQRQLDELNGWRNAIAHDNFNPPRPGDTIGLRLDRVRRYRRACRRLARAFDSLLFDHLSARLGRSPW